MVVVTHHPSFSLVFPTLKCYLTPTHIYNPFNIN